MTTETTIHASPFDDSIDDLMKPETPFQRKARISNLMRRLSDADLAALANNHDHPAHDYAVDEQDCRASILSDPRTAQALGEAPGERPA